MSAVMEKEFLTVKDIVAMGLCSQAQAYCLFNSETFPAIRIGAALRVRKSDFEKWIDEQKGGGGKMKRSIAQNKAAPYARSHLFESAIESKLLVIDDWQGCKAAILVICYMS